MASKGTLNTADYEGRYLQFNWSIKSQDITKNTTTIEWTLKGAGTGRVSWYLTQNIKVNLDGQTVYSWPLANGQITLRDGTEVASGTYTFAHQADGTRTFNVYVEAGIYIWEVNCTGSATFTLDTIPRATTPTMSASSVDMGSALTISMSRASSNFVHDLYYSFAGNAFVYIAGDLGTSYTWTVPDLATQIPNTTSGTVTLRCVTRSGSTTIGTKDVTFTARVPGSVMPTISKVTLTEATEGMAAQFGAFVKKKSQLSVSVTAAGAKGSTIKSCSSTLEGMNYTGLNFTTNVLTEAGTLDLVTTVVDTRGRSVKLTTKVNVLDYHLPETSKLVVYRVDANGNAKSDGKYLFADYSYLVAPVGNKNTAAMTLSYKRSIDTRWTVLTTSAAYNGAVAAKFSTEFTTDYQYDIKLEVEDWFKATASYTATLPTANVILDIKAEGDGLAFGKTSEFPGFEVAMPANGESFKMVGVRSYQLGDGSGYILYNNGLLLQWGAISVTPTAVNAVTSLVVQFPIPYKTRPHITGTALVNSPQALSWSLGVGTTDAAGLSSLVLYMYRSTLHATPFRWMAIGLADMTEVTDA